LTEEKNRISCVKNRIWCQKIELRGKKKNLAEKVRISRTDILEKN
jgi:hypothetical protein